MSNRVAFNTIMGCVAVAVVVVCMLASDLPHWLSVGGAAIAGMVLMRTIHATRGKLPDAEEWRARRDFFAAHALAAAIAESAGDPDKAAKKAEAYGAALATALQGSDCGEMLTLGGTILQAAQVAGVLMALRTPANSEPPTTT